MTQRDRLLLTLLVPVLVLGGVWFLLLSPQRKEAERLDTDLAAEQQRLNAAEGEVIRFQAAREELARAMADLTAAGKAVPADTAVPALLRQLQGTATRSGVEMEAVTTAASAVEVPAPAATATATAETAATPPPTATAVQLSLTFNGDFFDLQRMLERLDRVVQVSQQRVKATGRLLSVSDLQLVQEKGELVAQVEASVFVLPTVTALLPAAGLPADGAVPAAAGGTTDTPGGSLAAATPAVP